MFGCVFVVGFEAADDWEGGPDHFEALLWEAVDERKGPGKGFDQTQQAKSRKLVNSKFG